MKKIGLLYGMEKTFPQALIQRINDRHEEGITAEPVLIDKLIQGTDSGYAVIIDRISQDVPFYRSFLKNAALSGTAVINNPFWWSADEKFFNNCLATHIGVPVPKTVLLPSFELPSDTSDQSFSNLAYPLDWENIFRYIGFPAYMKPFAGGGWKNVYRLPDEAAFFRKHAETGQLVMMLQEEIIFDSYFRCYCVGGEKVRIMHYEPRHPHHERYQVAHAVPETLLDKIERCTLLLNRYLGYDFNTVEFAVRDDVPYAIDFCNPAPDADRASVGEENFEWVVNTAADYAIQRARDHKPGTDNLTWGQYLMESVGTRTLLKKSPKSGGSRKAQPTRADRPPAGKADPGRKTSPPQVDPTAQEAKGPFKQI